MRSAAWLYVAFMRAEENSLLRGVWHSFCKRRSLVIRLLRHNSEGPQLNPKQHQNMLVRAFEAARDQWRGCMWHSPIGPAGADVHELNSRQASLLAEATCGRESEGWAAAGRWLAKVERDALAAEKLAQLALHQVRRGCYPDAVESINRAVALEAQYRPPEVWTTLQQLIAQLPQNSAAQLVQDEAEHSADL